MAIALIGAILKRNASEQKWKSISEKLQKSHYHLHVKLKDWNYQHPTLNASIELRYYCGTGFRFNNCMLVKSRQLLIQ